MRINRKLIKNKLNSNNDIEYKFKNLDLKSDFFKVKSFTSNKTKYPDSVSCFLNCRLGNNLFQIAATIGLAIENNAIPIFENWEYSDYFDWDLTFDSEIHETINWEVYGEPKFTYLKIPYKNNIKLFGFFQSCLFFPETIILDKFKMNSKVYNYINEKYGNLLNNKTTSIHIRRTDYVDNINYHQIKFDYYLNAINLLKNVTDKFIVFSDDIEWCKNNFKNIDVDISFVEGEKDIIDLFIMSLCNNNIISNSTFSWWGAFLNKNENKQIIAANKWFGPELLPSHDETYIIPSTWKKIDC